MWLTKHTMHLFTKAAIISYLLLAYCTTTLAETCLMCATNYKSACAYQGGTDAQIPEGATVCGFATPQDACASLGKTYRVSNLSDSYCSGSQYNRLWVLINNTPNINGPKNNGGGVDGDDGCDDGNPPSPRKGNPIHIGTGNKYQMQTVYQGGGEWGLSLSFHYNSLLPSTSNLGAQWQTNFARKISLINANTVNITRADAKIYPFKKVATAWQGDADVSERLIEQKNTAGVLIGWQYRTLRDETEQYDSQGKLVSITTRTGKTTVLTYDASDRINQIQSPSGKTLTFSYDATNRIYQITTPIGELITLSYDNNNNLASITWPDNTTRQFLYENTTYTHALTGVVAENGQRYATYTYSAISGRATGSEHAGGADKIAVAYNNDGVRTRVIDALGAVRMYNMTVTNGVSRIAFVNETCASCGGVVAKTSYDASGRVLTQSDFKNNVTRYTRETRGLVTKKVEAEGRVETRVTSTEWHPTYRLPMRIAKPYLITTYTRDAQGNVLTRKEQATTDAIGALGFTAVLIGTPRIWAYTNNSDGQVISIDGSRADVADITQYTYDTDGNVSSITDAVGRITTLSYNQHGKLTSAQSPSGTVTNMGYDNMQRLTSSSQDGMTSTFSYDANGNLTASTSADGSQLHYQYDAANRLTGMTDSLGNSIQYTLDGKGNITQQDTKDPQGNIVYTHKRAYNLLNQLSKDLSALNHATQYTYDANGNLTQETNPLNLSTTFVMDALKRTTQSTNPAGGIIKYTYDAADRITKVVDPKTLITTYTYNGYGDKLTISSPDTGLTAYTYDLAGNRISQKDARNKITTYTYDAANRLISQTDADGNAAQTTYDITGGIASISEAHTSLNITRDTTGRVLTTTQTTGTVSLTQTHTYNPAGQRTQSTTPTDTILQYQYNPQGRIQSITATINGNPQPIASNIQYTPFSGWVSYYNAHGTGTLRSTNQDGLINIYSLDDTLRSLNYDAHQRITQSTDYLISDPTQTSNAYTYGYNVRDELNQQSSTNPTSTIIYNYEANSNRVKKTINATITPYTYATTSNRLTQVGTQTYTYDATGNTLSDGINQYTYNAMGRMASSTNAQGLTTTYYYNAQGQRIKKQNVNATTYTAYDEQGHVIGEYDANGNPNQETVWLYDTPIAVIKQNQVYAIHTDHLNTPRVITDSTNQAVWAWPNNEAFGNTPANEDPNNTSNLFTYNLRFPGQLYDSETKTHYNYFRDSYAPDVGRYYQSDPIGLEGGINTYGYVGGNPMSFTDAEGLSCTPPAVPPKKPPKSPLKPPKSPLKPPRDCTKETNDRLGCHTCCTASNRLNPWEISTCRMSCEKIFGALQGIE